ncbi:MAG: hypothetical protein JWN70_5030 [Planctomycetaceae bacterium]|nr:hypothetical protein [Planctomycetaceae bacterium]
MRLRPHSVSLYLFAASFNSLPNDFFAYRKSCSFEMIAVEVFTIQNGLDWQHSLEPLSQFSNKS